MGRKLFWDDNIAGEIGLDIVYGVIIASFLWIINLNNLVNR